MCGRYASSRTPEDLVDMFEVAEIELPDLGARTTDAVATADAADVADAADAAEPEPNFNVAPTVRAPVVLERRREVERPETGDGDGAGEGDAETVTVRQLRYLTWGLVPSWSKDPKAGARMINARAESLLEKPAYKRAAVSRRCLVPADGWYEWQKSPTEKVNGKPRKQPFFTHLADGGTLAFAGLYEFWRDEAKHADDPTAWLVTYAVVTTDAEPGLDVIHDRMPLVLPPDRWSQWLDPTLREPDAIRALLERPEPGRFAAVPVTTRVNSVRNNGPELLEPAPTESLHGVIDPVTGEVIGGDAVPLF